MMISPRPPSHWLCSRRALARISSMPTSLESSTHSGAAARRWLALRIFGQRCSDTRPLRSSSPLILACEATKRWASSASAISSENSATGFPCSTAAFSAMLHTSALLPIAGPQQAPQQRALPHDLRVAAGVPRGGNNPRQLVHRGLPADAIELSHLAQPVDDREHVHGL